MTRNCIAVAATLAVFAPEPWTGPAAAQDLALTGAAILNPADESIRHGVLLIENGTVSRIAETVPPDFPGETLDLAGKFVIPALADLHSHTFGNNSPAGMPQLLGPQGTANAALYTGVALVLDLFSPEEMILSGTGSARRAGRGPRSWRPDPASPPRTGTAPSTASPPAPSTRRRKRAARWPIWPWPGRTW